MPRQVSVTLPGQKALFMGGVEDKKYVGTAGEGGREEVEDGVIRGGRKEGMERGYSSSE